MTITKHISATSRTTLKQTKIVLVWVFFLFYPGHGHEKFKPLQLVGFIVLVSGIMLYNEIIILPFWGFNKYTILALDEKKRAAETEKGHTKSVHNDTKVDSAEESLLKGK